MIAYPPASDLVRLLSRCATGDAGAFERLYRLVSPHLFALALHLLRDADFARDVVQESFINIWKHAAEYDPGKGAPMTWMVSIARHRALDKLRKANIATSLDNPLEIELLQDPGLGPDEDVSRRAEAGAVRDCMEQLTSAQRQCIMLAFFHGLTHSELANHLRQPLGTVKTWVRQSLLRLRECLEA